MSAQTPQVLVRKQNGILPAPASQASDQGKAKGAGDASSSRGGRGKGSGDKANEAKNETSKSSRSKAHNEGEKLVVRRLPPGLTEAEFSSILGADWTVGNGKVDWFSYAAGKISKDPYKPSRPGRAYLHVTKKDSIMQLSDVVRNAIWEDAKATASSPSLIGPPTLELAIYKKVPSNRKRTDARHGTIDQDPEFMAFLEELANPTPAREGPDDDAEDDLKPEVVTTTPLVEYLKEKKSRAKESSSKKDKHSRQESSRKGKDAQKDEEPSSKKKGKENKGDKSAKSSKDTTVKILTKKAATEQATEAAKNAASQIAASASAQEAPKSRRAGIAAAARILQRDLGLSPGSAHRRARQDAAKAEAEAKTVVSKDAPAKGGERPASPEKAAEIASANADSRPGTPTTTQQKAQSSSRRGRGGKNAKNKGDAPSQQPTQAATATQPPVILKKKANGDAAADNAEAASTEKPATATKSIPKEAPTSKGPSSKSSSQKKQPAVSADAVRGFVKHVNTSQGITEPVLREALEAFGTVSSLEIDKRKAFAFVDFADHDSLVKAMSASPVSVAQGSIQILERKDKKPAAASGSPAQTGPGGGGSEKSSNRGRRGKGGGGGKNFSSNNAQPATAAASSGSAAAG